MAKKTKKRHGASARRPAPAKKKDRRFEQKKPKKPSGSVKKMNVHWSQDHVNKIAALTATIDKKESERETHRGAAAALTKEINTLREKRDALTRPTLPVDDDGQHNFLADVEVEEEAAKSAPKGKEAKQAKEGRAAGPQTPEEVTIGALKNRNQAITRSSVDTLYDKGLRTVADLYKADEEAAKKDSRWFDIDGITLTEAGLIQATVYDMHRDGLLPRPPKTFAVITAARPLALAGGTERVSSAGE